MGKIAEYLNTQFTILKYLNCAECEFSGQECIDFFYTMNHSLIQTLTFDSNIIGSIYLEEFAESIGSAKIIKNINLNECGIAFEGIVALADKMISSRLKIKSISLQGNRINVIYCLKCIGFGCNCIFRSYNIRQMHGEIP